MQQLSTKMDQCECGLSSIHIGPLYAVSCYSSIKSKNTSNIVIRAIVLCKMHQELCQSFVLT